MDAQRQFCTFLVDGLLFGVEAARVQEVIRHQEMTPVPLASTVVRGLINLRGQIITALDLRRRLGLHDQAGQPFAISVVIQSADGPVSFLADEIGEVLHVDDSTFEAAPETLRGPTRDLIVGTYKLHERLLLVLDIDRTCELPRPVTSSLGPGDGSN